MADSRVARIDTPAAEAAADGLAMLDALVGATPAAVAFVDEHLRYVRVNGPLADLNGVPLEEHAGRTVAEVIPAFADAARGLVGRVFATGETLRDLPIDIPAAGAFPARRILATFFPVPGPSGDVRWCGMVAVDVTERDRAVRELQESEERFRLAARAARDVVWDWTLADDRVRADGTARVFGFAEHALDDSTSWWEAQLHPDDRERVLASLAAVLREGEYWSEEYRHRRGDGSYATVVDRGYVVRDERGRAVRMVGVTTDVTLERASAGALAASEARFRSVFESEMIGIGFWGGGRVWEANDALLRLLGYTRDELEAGLIDTARLTPPDQRGREPEMMHEMERCSSVAPFEREFVRRDGSRVPVVVGGARFDAPPATAIFFVLDNSELRRVQEQAQGAQRMELIGRLAGGVAHEVNNALQAVLGYTDLVLRSLERGGVRREDLEQIRESAERAAGISHQLLAFSRRQLLRPMPLDLGAVVAELEPILRQALGGACELDLQLGAEPVRVSADRAQLEQALVNLALNARDAMPHGGRCTVRVLRRELTPDALAGVTDAPAPGPYGVLEFADTGIGMDEAVRARIFEPFFTTKPLGSATGLGLAAVHGIVRQSGGLVTCGSAPGAGATFAVHLPIATADPPS